MRNLLQILLHPIKAWQDYQYKKYKKDFFTKKALITSKKYNKDARRIK